MNLDRCDGGKLNIKSIDLRKFSDVAYNDVAKNHCIINWFQKLQRQMMRPQYNYTYL